MQLAPALAEAVSKRIRKSRSVAEALHGDQWMRDITGALSVVALHQFVSLWTKVQAMQLSSEPNRFIWRWTANRHYSAPSA
jgi:hypothetical protein